MSVTSVRAGGIEMYGYGDPVADAELAMVSVARQRRAGAAQERDAAYEAQDRELRQEESDRRSAADWRLVSGLVQGGMQVAEGAMNLDRASIEARQHDAEQSASRHADQLRDLGNASGTAGEGGARGTEAGQERDALRSALDRDNRSASELRGAAAQQEFRTQSVAGARQAIGASLDRVASQYDLNASAHERAAQHARRRAETANDTAQDANATAQRIEGRAEEASRAQEQATLQIFNALRA